jgi:WD40 repeat protein
MARLLAAAAAVVCLCGPAVADPPAGIKPRVDAFGDPLPEGALLRLGTLRFRQPAVVTYLAYRSDGKALVSVGSDDALRTWDPATGLLQNRLRLVSGVVAVWPAPHGRLLAVSNGTGLRIHETESGEMLAVWTDQVVAAAFARAAKEITTVSPQGILRRQLIQGKVLETVMLQAPDGVDNARQRLACAAVSPDGKSVAGVFQLETKAAEVGRVVRVWDAVTGRQRLELRGHSDGVLALQFSPDGSRLASGGCDCVVCLWDAATGKSLGRFHEPPADRLLTGIFKQRLAFSPDGRLLAVTRPGLRGLVHLWETQTGKLRLGLQAHPFEDVTAVAFHPTGKHLAIGRADGAISVIDIVTGKTVVASGDGGVCVGPVFFARDGKTVFVGQDGVVKQRDTATGKLLATFKGLVPYALSPNGKQLIVWAEDVSYPPAKDAAGNAVKAVPGPGLRVFATDTAKPLCEAPARHDGNAFVAKLPGGAGAALVVCGNGISILALETGQLVDPFPTWKAKKRVGAEEIYGITYDLRYVVTMMDVVEPDGLKWVRNLRDWGTGQLVGEIRAEDFANQPGEGPLYPRTDYFVVALASAPHGIGYLRDGGGHPRIFWEMQLFFVSRQRFRREPEGPPGPVFSPDGRIVALIEDSPQDIVLRDILTDRVLARFTGHKADVTHLQFSPDGRTLASTSEDTTVLLWDVTGLAKTPGQLPALTWSAAEQDQLWSDLGRGDGDGRREFAALWKFIAARKQTVELLRKLVPVARLDVKEMGALVADLDNPKFATRDAATRQLELLDGTQAALRKALAKNPTLEMRMRIEQILARLDDPAANPGLLRQLRAVMILEQIGTAEARQLLRDLAGGLADAHVTHAAGQALARLTDNGAR